MLATLNMKDIHNANLLFFSPQPYFIAAFFFPQQLFQLGWLYRLYKLDPTKSDAERRELDQLVDYVPYYSVGNLYADGSRWEERLILVLMLSQHGWWRGTRPTSNRLTVL